MNKIARICKILFLALCFSLYASGAVLAQATLLLENNQSTHLNAGDTITSVAIANPEIADVTVLSRENLLVVAKKPGTTTLSIWTENGMRQDYSVSVQDRDTETAIAIEQTIACPGVNVEMIGNIILLRGSVLNQMEKNRAEKIAEMYSRTDKDKVINLLEMTEPAQIRLEAKIVEIIKTVLGNN